MAHPHLFLTDWFGYSLGEMFFWHQVRASNSIYWTLLNSLVLVNNIYREELAHSQLFPSDRFGFKIKRNVFMIWVTISKQPFLN